MTDLAAPLLCKQPEWQVQSSPLQLQVLRHNVFQSSIASKHGEVIFRLSKRRPFHPFCIDWQLCDEVDKDAQRLNVKTALFRCSVSFEATTGTVLTTMVQKCGLPSSYFSWDGCTYRWDSVGSLVPLQLQLLNTATHERVASLQGSDSMPWSKQQQHINVFAGREDHVWLQVVVASGLAEAKRLGGGNSNTAPRRYAVR